MKRALAIVLVTFTIGACTNTLGGTLNGAGKDISSWGKSLSDSFDKDKQVEKRPLIK